MSDDLKRIEKKIDQNHENLRLDIQNLNVNSIDKFGRFDEKFKYIQNTLTGIGERQRDHKQEVDIAFDKFERETREKITNIDNRLTPLEKWKYGILLVVSVISFIAPFIIDIFLGGTKVQTNDEVLREILQDYEIIK